MKGFPILRSGFVSLGSQGLVQPENNSSAIAAALLNKRRLETDNNYFYHEAIQDLFQRTVVGSQSGILNDVAFMELVIKAANEAFATRNFWDWVNFQIEKGEITSMHAAFLIETINFIGGSKRKMQVEQWIRLLDATHGDSLVVTSSSSDYVSLGELQKTGRVPAGLAKVIVQWLRQPNGPYDFVSSLEVIFGNRRLFANSL